MKKWNFKVKGKPKENIEKLNSALQSFGGFNFKIDHDNNDSANFSFRKPINYPDQILHRNRIIVNGKILKTDTENESVVEITFGHHFFMIVTVVLIILLGLVLILIIPTVSSGVSMYVFEGIIFGLGIVLSIAAKNKFERDIEKYKLLISKIFI